MRRCPFVPVEIYVLSGPFQISYVGEWWCERRRLSLLKEDALLLSVKEQRQVRNVNKVWKQRRIRSPQRKKKSPDSLEPSVRAKAETIGKQLCVDQPLRFCILSFKNCHGFIHYFNTLLGEKQ